jgi:adenylate kinase family enzyme
MYPERLKKINVIGTSGSGKSEFSQELADALKIPYIEMDKIFWEPNWQQPSDEKFFKNLEAALNGGKWVLDGNYTRTIPIKWKNVETVVWLDYSFTTTVFQSIKRTVNRCLSKQEIWEGTGNVESFKKSFFSKDSIIWWSIANHSKNRRKYQNYLTNSDYSHIQFVHLKNHKEADSFLRHCS